MQRTKIKCPLCGQEISRSNYSKHQRRHENHPETFDKGGKVPSHDGLFCQFCGKECKNKNSLVQHEIRCPDNESRINVAIKGFNTGNLIPWNIGLTKETSASVEKQSSSLKEYYADKQGAFFGKNHTEESKIKISNSRKKYLSAHPEEVPYVLNHSSKVSFPEWYFMNILNEREIQFQYNYPVGRYRLDFANPSTKRYVEIDGEQHYLDKRIVEHDLERNNVLKELGWCCIRIRWSSYKKLKLEEKNEIINQICSFLS